MKPGTTSFGVPRDAADQYGNGNGRAAWKRLLEEYASAHRARAIRLMITLRCSTRDGNRECL